MYPAADGLGIDRVAVRSRVPAVCGVVHLWNLDATHGDGLDLPALAAAQETGLKSVVRLVQAWDQAAPSRSVPLVLATRGAESLGQRPELPRSPRVR